MEVLRLYFCFLLLATSLLSFSNTAEDKGFMSIEDAIMYPDSASFINLNADSTSLQLFRDNVALLSHIRGLAVQGEIAELQLLWEALAELELVEYLFFLDNNLDEIEIGGTSSTLKYLWIRNSPELEVQSLNRFLNRSNLILSLRLDHVGSGKLPKALKEMPILKELQLSNSDIIFKDLIGKVGKNSKLERLIISDNNFQFIGKGFKKMSKLSYLDLSGNNLSDEIPQLKYLEQLDTLILNRNALEDVYSISKQLQATRIDLLALDNQKDGIKNSIGYLLPGKEIEWNNNLCFPQPIELPAFNTSKKVIQKTTLDRRVQKASIKSYTGASEVQILSEAFLEYDRLVFPEPFKNFDTLQYEGRYLDSSYVFVEKIAIQNHTKYDEKHKLKYNRKYGGVKKTKKTVKIDHYKDSHVIFNFEEDKECDDGVIVHISFNQIKDHKRSDLKAFQQYVWLIDLSKEAFQQQFINQKAWSDIRMSFDGEFFIIYLKGRYLDDEFNAEFRYYRDPNELKDLKKTADKIFVRYEKASGREELRFNKSLAKKRNKKLRPYAKDITSLWAKVESKMSEKEKTMTHDEWLEYYESVKEHEFSLLQHTSLNLAYLARYMVGQGFKAKRSNDFYVGQRWIDATLIYQNDTLKIEQLCIVDLDQKVVSKVDVKNNSVLLEPFHDLVIYGVTDQQQFFRLSEEQIALLLDQREVPITTKDFLKKTSTTSIFYKENIYPLLTY